ncbi:MAG: excinuclease ABC subunit UvrC [Actinobacteria bacterium]|nr:excinuclease ABC subunit UvrC [Actinomycetota bacterium]
MINDDRIRKILEDADKLPDLPGVYIFKDSSDRVIYVGKAKSVKKRVKNHFLRPVDQKHENMLSKISEIDHIVTNNEVEALLLEYNLIKRYKPKYNVLYRDDKSYPYIAITLADEWPRLILTRNLNIEGARYFGPYPKASKAREVLDSLLKLFPLRTCKGKQPGQKGKGPCLMFHVKKCKGPCIGEVSKEDYLSFVNKVVEFLSGKSDWLVEKLEREMKEAASKLEFEKAAALREKLLAARHVIASQRAIFEKKLNVDVFGYYEAKESNLSYIRILQVRQGRVIGAYGYSFEFLNYDEAIKEAIYIFYSKNMDFPQEILLPKNLDKNERQEIEAFLREIAKKRITLKSSVKGERADLLKMADENAITAYFWWRFRAKGNIERNQKALEELSKLLKLRRIPLIIECYDMSGFKAENPVGTMVVFEEGQPARNLYRKYRIKEKTQSDYHKMLEVMVRRISKIQSSKDKAFSRIPDLIVLDGGRAQLSAAIRAFKETNKEDLLERIDLIALAKPENKVFMPGIKEPVIIPEGSEALKLLMRIRDEAHRTAIGYFRKLEEKRLKMSVLDTIKGVGPERKKRLIEYFGDVEKIRKASLYELQKVVPRDVAVRIKEVLSSN